MPLLVQKLQLQRGIELRDLCVCYAARGVRYGVDLAFLVLSFLTTFEAPFEAPLGLAIALYQQLAVGCRFQQMSHWSLVPVCG